MKPGELAEFIFKTLNVFDFLQFVDKQYEAGDHRCRALTDEFFRSRYPTVPNAKNLLPFAQLYTTLPILTVTVCFAATITQDEWNAIGFSMKPGYRIKFYQDDNDQAAVPTPDAVIRAIRNAIAHVPDFMAVGHEGPANVSFATGLVSFASRRPKSRVEFATVDGFRAFLTDYLRAIRGLAKTKLLQ